MSKSSSKKSQIDINDISWKLLDKYFIVILLTFSIYLLILLKYIGTFSNLMGTLSSDLTSFFGLF